MYRSPLVVKPSMHYGAMCNLTTGAVGQRHGRGALRCASSPGGGRILAAVRRKQCLNLAMLPEQSAKKNLPE